MTALGDKYRPQELGAVVGQPKAVKTARHVLERGLGGRALWISGPSGTGKTTLARILAGSIADRFFQLEVDASYLTADRLRELADTMRLFGGGQGGKVGRAFIVNEAHGLKSETIRKLLVLLEDLPPHVVWIFTTTKDGQAKLFDDHGDTGPLLSRCLPIETTSYGTCGAFAQRLQEIAKAEGLDGQPRDKYERLVRDNKSNFRTCLQAIDAGAMMGGKP